MKVVVFSVKHWPALHPIGDPWYLLLLRLSRPQDYSEDGNIKSMKNLKTRTVMVIIYSRISRPLVRWKNAAVANKYRLSNKAVQRFSEKIIQRHVWNRSSIVWRWTGVSRVIVFIIEEIGTEVKIQQ